MPDHLLPFPDPDPPKTTFSALTFRRFSSKTFYTTLTCCAKPKIHQIYKIFLQLVKTSSIQCRREFGESPGTSQTVSLTYWRMSNCLRRSSTAELQILLAWSSQDFRGKKFQLIVDSPEVIMKTKRRPVMASGKLIKNDTLLLIKIKVQLNAFLIGVNIS